MSQRASLEDLELASGDEELMIATSDSSTVGSSTTSSLPPTYPTTLRFAPPGSSNTSEEEPAEEDSSTTSATPKTNPFSLDGEGNPSGATVFAPEAVHQAVMPALRNSFEFLPSHTPTSGYKVATASGNAVVHDSSFASTAAGDHIWHVDDLEIEHDFEEAELKISDIDEKYNNRLRRARIVSYFAFIFSICQGAVALGFGISYSVVSLTAMGAQLVIDLLSSVLVVWRFYYSAHRNPRHAEAQIKVREAVREKRAALGVGILLVFTACWAATWAFIKVFGTPPPATELLVRAKITLAVAWPGFFIFGIFATAKWYFALRIRSRVLQKDAVCTSFGVALSFVTALFATIDYGVSDGSAATNTGAADSVAALIVAALLFVEGIRTVYKNSLGWVPPNGVTKEVVAAYYQSRKAVKS